jgi:hypothetical protein
MKTQNTSHAVMSQRDPASDTNDFFPTPPWATRALCEKLIAAGVKRSITVWEPACGAGHMVWPLSEYFDTVIATDIAPANSNFRQMDFLGSIALKNIDWIITNPPFSGAAVFAQRGLQVARDGVALLVRTQFLEGVDRWNTLFTPHPPAFVWQFVERVPMHKGRLLRTGSTATSYCWIVWKKTVFTEVYGTELGWIAPCRKRLEKDSDYSDASE